MSQSHDTTIRSPFCTCHTTSCVELRGEDLSYYSNEIESVSLRKCPYDHWFTNKAYLSAITVTNTSQSFTYKMAAKINWHRYWTKLRHCHPMYCDEHACCVCVRLFVCPRGANISPVLNVQSVPNFYACYLWPWLDCDVLCTSDFTDVMSAHTGNGQKRTARKACT